MVAQGFSYWEVWPGCRRGVLDLSHISLLPLHKPNFQLSSTYDKKVLVFTNLPVILWVSYFPVEYNDSDMTSNTNCLVLVLAFPVDGLG